MGQLGGCFDFREETLAAHHSSKLGLEHFQSHVSMVPEILSQIHDRHPTLADLTLDAVAALEGCVKTGDGVGGHWFPISWRSSSNQLVTRMRRSGSEAPSSETVAVVTVRARMKRSPSQLKYRAIPDRSWVS